MEITLSRKTKILFYVAPESTSNGIGASLSNIWSKVVQNVPTSIDKAKHLAEAYFTRLKASDDGGQGISSGRSAQMPPTPIIYVTNQGSDGDLLSLNAQEYYSFVVWIDELEQLLMNDTIPNSVKECISKKIYWIKDALQIFKKRFEKAYPNNARDFSKKVAKYSIEHLAHLYVDYVHKSGRALPSQNELGDNTDISQPTWNRAFARKNFWKEVRKQLDDALDDSVANVEREEKKKENLIHSMHVAEQKIEYYTNKKKTNKCTDIQPDELPDEEIDSDERIDNDLKVQKMSKDEIIHSLCSIFPEIKQDELNEMSLPTLRSFALKMQTP